MKKTHEYMKKILLILASTAVILTGCKVETADTDVNPLYVDAADPVTYKTFRLVYMPDTHIIYYTGTYVLTPYYSKHGKLCRYEDGKIIEIAN